MFAFCAVLDCAVGGSPRHFLFRCKGSSSCSVALLHALKWWGKKTLCTFIAFNEFRAALRSRQYGTLPDATVATGARLVVLPI